MEKILVCVYSTNKVDWDALLTLNAFNLYEEEFRNSSAVFCASDHEYGCDARHLIEELSVSGTECDSWSTEDQQEIRDLCGCSNEDSPIYYSDGEFTSGTFDVKGETILLCLHPDTGVIQVLLSPEVWERGYASLCYPNQCEEHTDGDIVCYKLPDDYQVEY